MKIISRILGAFALIALFGADAPEKPKGESKGGAEVLQYKMKDIDGKDVDLAKYKGKVTLIVNVASKCGYTPQYEQLEAMHEKYKDKGLAILGFPANDFGKQEPGTEQEIKEFCTGKFNVKFDMFGKITVKGDEAPPLYKDLTSKEKNGEFGGDIKWNFTKFLVGKDGKVVARYESKVKPDAPEVVAAIEKELAKK